MEEDLFVDGFYKKLLGDGFEDPETRNLIFSRGAPFEIIYYAGKGLETAIRKIYSLFGGNHD